MAIGQTQRWTLQNRRNRPGWAVPAVLLVPLVAGVLAGCKEDSATKADRPLPVRVATVALEPLTETRRYTGVIRPRFESDLGFRVAGKVIERRVNVGDRVKAGDVIARLDVADFKLALEAQEAELAAATSSRDKAIAAEQRYKILKTKGWVSQAGLDSQTSAADEARSRVERAQRTLDTQRNQVAYTELHADHDGVVSALPVEAGQVVAAGQAVARVARLDELEAVVAIPEQKLDEVKLAAATVQLWPETTKKYQAKLREISPDADPVSRTFEVRFAVAQADEDVRLGKTANVTLQQSDARSIARLPLSAVMNDAKGPMVWVVDASGSKLERRKVSIESFGQDTAVVASGLKDGERVVTLGVHVLDAGMTVRIVETKTVAGASQPVR